VQTSLYVGLLNHPPVDPTIVDFTRLIEICKHVYHKYGYNKNKFLLTDYPMIGFPKNMYYSYANEADKEDNVDDDMKEYLQMILDEMKNKNKNDPRS
jgi:hypothetical protein